MKNKESVNRDWTMITLPILRKLNPQLLAKELLGVQPMEHDHAEVFKLKRTDGVFSAPRQGEWCHDFIKGHLRYYGTQWIPEHVWTSIKLKGL